MREILVNDFKVEPEHIFRLNRADLAIIIFILKGRMGIIKYITLIKALRITFLLLATLCAFDSLRAQDNDLSHCPMYNVEEPADFTAFTMVTTGCNPSTDICTGRYKPGKGTLKILMVYIRFADDHTSMSYWNSKPNPSDINDVETWMKKSLDENLSVGSDNYFNITNYFNQMSRGAYTVIGDVVYIEIPSISTFRDKDDIQLTGISLMEATNKYVLEYLDNSPQIDLSDYDNFEYVSGYHHDQKADNILDMVYMVYRTPGLEHFARKDTPGFEYDSFGGIAKLGKTSLQVALPSGLIVDYGLFGDGSGLTIHLGDNRKVRFDDSYIHELAHYLIGYNHPYTDGEYYVNKVGRTGYWGIFGGNQATNSVNVYEQELLGWIAPAELIKTGTFSLRDFVTTGDSFKYTISSTEFYYFVNRQRVQTTSGIDDTYDQPNKNNNDMGLFVLHVKENSLGYYLYVSDNSLESVVSDGNWDWSIDGFSSTCNPSGEPAFEKDNPNRYGESFKDPLMEVDNPFDSSGPYKQSLFVKASNPTQCKRYFLGHDAEDKSGFTELERSLITPYTNPAFLTRSKSQSGIGMKIINKTGSTLLLKFYDDTFDHYTISENTIWDRQIFLDQNITIENYAKLTILPGTTVYLEEDIHISVQPGAQFFSEGTEENPIRFKRIDPDKAWNTIYLNSSAGNSIKWSHFDGGETNLTIASQNNTIEHSIFRNAAFRNIDSWHNQDGPGNSSATLSHVIIEDGATVGLVAQYINMDISNTTIQRNAEAGIYITSATVYPFHYNNVINNGGKTRDGVEVMSTGTFYMHAENLGYGYNEVSGNGDDQVSGSGDIAVGFSYPLSNGGYNSIHGDFTGGSYLVDNWSSNTIMAERLWWGLSFPHISMFKGLVQYDMLFLISEPTTGKNLGSSIESQEKLLTGKDDEVLPITEVYYQLERNLDKAETSQLIRDGLHRMYQVAWLAIEEAPELLGQFLQLARQASEGKNLLYESAVHNQILQHTAVLLYAKSLIRNGNYEDAGLWIWETSHLSLEGTDCRDRLHLIVDLHRYNGNANAALETLQDLYANEVFCGDDIEGVKLNYKPIEDDIDCRMGVGISLEPGCAEKTENFCSPDILTLQNFPNPFKPTTQICFTLARQSKVSLVVFDILGREVASLVDDMLPAGKQSVLFDASNLANGVYFYRLTANQQERVQIMTLIN